MQQYLIRSLTTLLILLLAACSTPKKDTVFTPSPAKPVNPETLLTQARFALDPAQRQELYLQAAELYWENSLPAQSQAALSDLNPGVLPQNLVHRYQLLRLRIALYNNKPEDISTTLALLNIHQLSQSSIEQQLELTELIARAYESIDQPIRAAIILIEHQGLYDEDVWPQNNELIWQHLRNTATTDIIQYEYTGDHPDVIAWLELASALKLNQANLEQQYRALRDWQIRWPNHPAASNLPTELNLLAKLPETSPTQIVLALPYSGTLSEVGKAIRDGFMAKMYLSSKTGPIPRVVLLDTAKQDFLSAYDLEHSEQSLIVGPLEKESIAVLANMDEVPIRTLALNLIPEDQLRIPDNLYQFALAPDTESRQAAQHMTQLGLTKIGVIAPEEDWGLRAHDAFLDEAIDNQAAVIESVFYQNQDSLSSAVARLLATEQSQERAKTVQGIIGRGVETLPRRRQDIDAIFMVAKPETAKQINPLLAYHYASDLPVYATSQVHSGQHSANLEDLNDIYFVEMPWMLSNTNNIKNTINQMTPEKLQRYSRFFALGADAFELSPRLELLQTVTESQLEGQTGILSIDNNGVVQRHLQWARFNRGRAIPIQD